MGIGYDSVVSEHSYRGMPVSKSLENLLYNGLCLPALRRKFTMLSSELPIKPPKQKRKRQWKESHEIQAFFLYSD